MTMLSRGIRNRVVGLLLFFILIFWASKLYHQFVSPSAEEQGFSGGFHQDNQIYDCITGDVVAKYRFESEFDTFERKLKYENLENDSTSALRIKRNNDTKKEFKNSGRPSSTSLYGQETIASLHALVNKIRSETGKKTAKILDVPCGDMRWMIGFLRSRTDVIYTGMDVSPTIIDHHAENFVDPHWNFVRRDVKAIGELPEVYDIVVSRHLLKQLSVNEALKLLLTFGASHHDDGSPTYFFTSNHYPTNYNIPAPPPRVNQSSRFINLEVSPYNFAPPFCIVPETAAEERKVQGHYVAIYRLPFIAVGCAHKPYKNSWLTSEQFLYSCTRWNQVSTIAS